MEHVSKSCICLALETGSNVEYFKNLPLLDLERVAQEIQDVLRERNGG